MYWFALGLLLASVCLCLFSLCVCLSVSLSVCLSLPVCLSLFLPLSLLPFIIQVSWAKPHDEAPKGTIKIDFYDDEGASALRKVFRLIAIMAACCFTNRSSTHRCVRTDWVLCVANMHMHTIYKLMPL